MPELPDVEWRHGKWLVVPVGDGPVMLLRFGMTGALHWTAERHRHDRAVFTFDNG